MTSLYFSGMCFGGAKGACGRILGHDKLIIFRSVLLGGEKRCLRQDPRPRPAGTTSASTVDVWPTTIGACHLGRVLGIHMRLLGPETAAHDEDAAPTAPHTDPGGHQPVLPWHRGRTPAQQPLVLAPWAARLECTRARLTPRLPRIARARHPLTHVQAQLPARRRCLGIKGGRLAKISWCLPPGPCAWNAHAPA